MEQSSGLSFNGKELAVVGKGFAVEYVNQQKDQQLEAYRVFVSQGNPKEIEKFYFLKNLPSVLGYDSFANWIKGSFRHVHENRGSPEVRQLTPSAEQIIALVCEYFQVQHEQLLLSRRGNENMMRDLAIYPGACLLGWGGMCL